MNHSIKPGRMCVYAGSHAYTFTSLTKTTYTGPIIAHETLSVYCYPAVNQTPALIVLDGFEPPALVQAQALIRSYIRYVYKSMSDLNYFMAID